MTPLLRFSENDHFKFCGEQVTEKKSQQRGYIKNKIGLVQKCPPSMLKVAPRSPAVMNRL
jgi:hypothetical protein